MHDTSFSFSRRILVSILLISGMAMPFLPANAAITFNPHNLISDEEMRNENALNLAQVTAFLNSKGKLGTITDIDPVDGVRKNAAQLIVDTAKRYDINPKYLLVLLQKESSIVEGKNPTQRQIDWATGYALCDGCSRTSTLALKYKGLAKQIDAGAGWMDWFYKNNSKVGYLLKPGKTYTINKTSVTPTSMATAALYSYTPHISGNQLFVKIWHRWFGEGSISQQLTMPDGAVLKNTKTGEYAVVQGGAFRTVKYKSLIGTRFSSTGVIMLSDAEYKTLTTSNPGKPIAFADLALVRVEDGTIYLLIGNTRRRIVSQDVFKKIGFNPEEVEEATIADITDFIPGPDITAESGPIEPRLLQDMTTGGIFYVEDNTKHPLWDKALLMANFPHRTVVRVPSEELSALKVGKPIRFLDGTLVKAVDTPGVYLISGGKKRAITSEKVFLGLGFSWNSIITTSRAALDLHDTGADLIAPEDDLKTDTLQTASL